MADPSQENSGSNREKLTGLAQPKSVTQREPSRGLPPWERKEAVPPSTVTFGVPLQGKPEMESRVPDTGTPAASMSLAGMWNRTWCWFIDSVVAFLISVILAVLIVSPFIFIAPESNLGVLILAAGFVGSFLTYFAASYRWWGRTPVMMIARLYVIDASTGERLTWGRAYLRSLVLCMAQVFGLIAIIWIALTASSPLKQGPHDRAGKSLVVQRSR